MEADNSLGTTIRGLTLINGDAGLNDGGGIYIGANSSLSCINCIISNCKANNGGGIRSLGDLSLTESCSVTGNTATAYNSKGGGIYSTEDLEIVNTNTINNNSAKYGGGIYAEGYELLIFYSTVANNTATVDGGGVYSYHQDGETLFLNSTIKNNTTTTGNGGGIYCNEQNSPYLSFTMTDSLIAQNNAYKDGGGIYNNSIIMDILIMGSTITSNSTTTGNGGGIYRNMLENNGYQPEGTLPIYNNSTLTHNNAYNNGGGIYYASSNETLFIGKSITIAHNSTTIGNGGGIYYNGQLDRNPLIMQDTLLAENSASNGGGIYNSFSNGLITIGESTITNNTTTGGDGGAIWSKGTAVLRQTQLTGNIGSGSGLGGGLGGAVYLYPSNGIASIVNCLLTYNQASSGGAIYSQGHAYLDYNTFYANSVLNQGCAIYNEAGSSIRNNIFAGHTNTGIYTIYSQTGQAVSNCSYYGNSINYNGNISSTNEITADPLFVDISNRDYHLQSGSPCIDTAQPDPSISNDFEDITRPLDGDNNGTSKWDIGCYEYLNIYADSDGDTIKDFWEMKYNMNPANASDKFNNKDNDALNNYDEYISDTDPSNSNSYFRITAISNNPSFTVYFNASTNRLYVLNYCTNIVTGTWTNVPGVDPRMGTDGQDFMSDTNNFDHTPYYRMKVMLP